MSEANVRIERSEDANNLTTPSTLVIQQHLNTDMDLFSDTPDDTIDTDDRRLSRAQLRQLRDLIRAGSKTDRYIIKKEVIAYQVRQKETTDNSTHCNTRLSRRTVSTLEHIADTYDDVTVSQLIREAVEYAISRNLYSHWHSRKEDNDE